MNRKTIRQALTALFIVPMLAMVAHGRGLAQEASPIAFPALPLAAECTVEPRDVGALLEVIGTPVEADSPSEPPPSPTPISVPMGEPADLETEAAVTQVIRLYISCINAEDPARALSLVTDEYFRRIAQEEEPTTPGDLAAVVAEPASSPIEAPSMILAVSDVMRLADGRVSGFVVTDHPYAAANTAYVIFVQQDGRWLIDEVIEFIEPKEPTTFGTPMPE